MSHGEILRQAILEDPSDIDARLVYGDYLAELDDPRGEFIQCEVAAHRLPAWTPDFADLYYRARELENLHRKSWDTEIYNVINRAHVSQGPADLGFQRLKHHYRTGFADHFEMDSLPIDFTPIRELIQTTPLRKISIGCNDTLSQFAQPEMGIISELALRGNLQGAQRRTSLFGSDSPLKLQSLKLYLSRLSATQEQRLVSDLARSKALEQLSNFGCNVCSTSSDLFQQLVSSPTFRHVRHLDLTESLLGDRGMEIVAKSHLVKQLQSLNIKMCAVGDAGLMALAQACPEKLQHLSLGWWYGKNPTAVGLEALFRSAGISSLESLNLKGLRTDMEVFRTLTSNPALSQLRRISLCSTKLNDEKSDLLAEGYHLRPTWLDLGSNRSLTLKALRRLLNSEFAQDLTFLNLEKFAFGGHKVAQIVVQSDSLKKLRYLNLSDTSAGRSLVETLAGTENAEQLRELRIDHIDQLTAKEVKMLLDRDAFPNLQFLSVVGGVRDPVLQERLQSHFSTNRIEPSFVPV